MNTCRSLRIAASAALCLVAACSETGPDLTDLVPERLANYDPQVIELAEQQLAIIRSRPDDAAAYAKLAFIYEANGVWPAAERTYHLAESLNSKDTWWRFHHAVAAREAGELEHSLWLLRQLASELPDLAPVQQRLGQALAEDGDLDGAAAAYARVVELLPNAPAGHLGLGEIRLLERDYSAARGHLERAVTLDPGYRAARHALGLAYRGLGMNHEAARELRLGLDAQTRYLASPLTSHIQTYGVNLQAQRNLASSLLLGGRPDQSAEILEKVLQRHPDSTTDLNNLAIAYMRMGRLDEAQQLLDRSGSLEPGKFSTWLNLAALANRKGDYATAAGHARRAIELAPNMAQPHISLAMAEAELDNPEIAADALAEAVRLDPRNPQSHGMLAEISVSLGRYDVAEEQFRAVLQLVPDSLTALLGLGRLYLLQERIDDASGVLQRLRELAPGHPQIQAFEREYATIASGETG